MLCASTSVNMCPWVILILQFTCVNSHFWSKELKCIKTLHFFAGLWCKRRKCFRLSTGAQTFTRNHTHISTHVQSHQCDQQPCDLVSVILNSGTYASLSFFKGWLMLSLRANTGTNWPPTSIFLFCFSFTLSLSPYLWFSPPPLVVNSLRLYHSQILFFSPTSLKYLTLFSFCPFLFPVVFSHPLPPSPPSSSLHFLLGVRRGSHGAEK